MRGQPARPVYTAAVWALDNRTPYAAARNWTRHRDGMHWWIVAVKASFDVPAAGGVRLADEQPPPVLTPEHFGAPGASSLRRDSDLLAVKPGTDVLVEAHAHAPRGKPAETVDVVLQVGALTKRLRVHGLRTYDSLGHATASQPFVAAPIRYEYAFGGADTGDADPAKQRLDSRNPVGRGFVLRAPAHAGKPAHTIEYPGGDPTSAGPAGFGPIDPSWSPRRELAGTFDERWQRTRRPLLPDDHDPAFAQCAPTDQRPAQPLVGGERISLIHMTPEGTWSFELPRISLGFTTRLDGRHETHAGQLTSVLLEPEERRVALVWQAALRVRISEADYLDVTEIREHRGPP